MAIRMQQRRGTSSQWTTANPILAVGELGFVIDTGEFKIGDGIHNWTDLTAFNKGSDAAIQAAISNILDGAPEALNTLKELALALNVDPDFGANMVSLISGKAPKLNAELIGTPTAPTPATNDNSTKIATTAFVKAQDYATANSVSSLSTTVGTLSTTVDGINTAVSTTLPGEITTVTGRVTTLEGTANTLGGRLTTAEADIVTAKANIASAQGDITTANGNISTITSNLSTHEAKTTNVHGIANTASLATKSYADSAATTAAGTVSTNLTTHTSGTTNVHGIADTSKLVTKDAASQTISGNVTITGNLVVSGTTETISSTTVTIADPMIYLGGDNSGNSVDLGFVSSFNDGTYQHSGLVRDASDSKWKIFKGVTDEPTTTVNFTQGSLDALAVGAFEATSANIGGVAFTDKADKTAAITSQTGSYTIVTGDVNNVVEYNSASAGTFTIPADNSFWPVGRRMEVLQVSSGQVTIAGGSGVTVNGTPTTKTRTQWSGATIIKRAANTFVVVGDLASS